MRLRVDTMGKKVYFKGSEGNRLCGVLCTAGTVSKPPIAILCHGLDSSKESNTNAELSAALSRSGIAVFRFDFFAHGESEGGQKYRTVSRFVDDVTCAISYLREIWYKRIGIVGASFGGIAAVMAASRVGGLSFLALKPPGMSRASRMMPNYKKDFENKTWFAAAKKIRIPAPVVHGADDEVVEVAFGVKLAECIKSSKLEKIEGADHRYTREDDFKKMVKLISTFAIENSM